MTDMIYPQGLRVLQGTACLCRANPDFRAATYRDQIAKMMRTDGNGNFELFYRIASFGFRQIEPDAMSIECKIINVKNADHDRRDIVMASAFIGKLNK